MTGATSGAGTKIQIPLIKHPHPTKQRLNTNRRYLLCWNRSVHHNTKV